MGSSVCLTGGISAKAGKPHHQIHAFQYDNLGRLAPPRLQGLSAGPPGARDSYAALKIQLASQFPADIDELLATARMPL